MKIHSIASTLGLVSMFAIGCSATTDEAAASDTSDLTANSRTIVLNGKTDTLTLTYETEAPPNDGTNRGVFLLAKKIKLTVKNGAKAYPPGLARAALVNICTDPASKDTRQFPVQKDLSFAGGSYQGDLENVNLKWNVTTNATFNCRQELAVVVDGRWIKAPNGDNFRFTF